MEVFPLPRGLSMLTAGDLDDPTSPRIRDHLPRFRAAQQPDPEAGDWRAWQEILASRVYDMADGPFAAMSVATGMGFETVSSALIALPGRMADPGGSQRRPVWLFAPGRPDVIPYQSITM